MAASRLALRQEFQHQLRSRGLTEWYEAARCRDASLANFPTPAALCGFLHSAERGGTSKAEIWRMLVKEWQRHRTEEATTFVIGLLEPALGALTDRFDTGDLDSDDLWQEAVAAALDALADPKVPGRRAVLKGLKWDTFYRLRHWLRAEFRKSRNEAPVFEELAYMPELDEAAEINDEEALLGAWCRAAGVRRAADAALIVSTRLDRQRLSQLVPVSSRTYYRLWKRRKGAERRLKVWLERTSNDPLRRSGGTSFSKNSPKTHSLKGDASTGAVDADRVPTLADETTERTKPWARPRRATSESVAA
jgi:hypothetical protein